MRFVITFIYFSIIFCKEDFCISHLFTSSLEGRVFYNGPTTGKCYGNDLPEWVEKHGLITATINSGDNEDESCGLCVLVSGQGFAPFTVFIHDTAPGNPKDITLSSPGKGHSPISWQAIPCPVDNTPISYIVLTNNQNPLQSIQIKVIGHKLPIKSLSLQTSSTQWITATRTPDNYFEIIQPSLTDPLNFPLTIKITSINKEELIDQIPSISINNNLIIGNVQFTRQVDPSGTDYLIEDNVIGITNREVRVDEDSRLLPSNDTIMTIGLGLGSLLLGILIISILIMVRKIRKRRTQFSQIA
jgi:hypothetical protein